MWPPSLRWMRPARPWRFPRRPHCAPPAQPFCPLPNPHCLYVCSSVHTSSPTDSAGLRHGPRLKTHLSPAHPSPPKANKTKTNQPTKKPTAQNIPTSVSHQQLATPESRDRGRSLGMVQGSPGMGPGPYLVVVRGSLGTGPGCAWVWSEGPQGRGLGRAWAWSEGPQGRGLAMAGCGPRVPRGRGCGLCVGVV